MIFRLKYDGPLLAEGRGSGSRIENKHHIRKQFHKQLACLWQSYYALIVLGNSKEPDGTTTRDWLAKNFTRCGFQFVPLVSTHWHLICDLEILFLRRDDPGKLVKSGGDIDNRIKTLFDALRIPAHCSELAPNAKPDPDEQPFYCLLEDDSLITGFRVASDRLLTPKFLNQDDDDISLILTVKVLPSRVGLGTVLFL